MEDLNITRGDFTARVSVDFAKNRLKSNNGSTLGHDTTNGIFHNTNTTEARYVIGSIFDGEPWFLTQRTDYYITKDVTDLMEDIRQFFSQVKESASQTIDYGNLWSVKWHNSYAELFYHEAPAGHVKGRYSVHFDLADFAKDYEFDSDDFDVLNRIMKDAEERFKE